MSRSESIKKALADRKAEGKRVSRRVEYGKRLLENGRVIDDHMAQQAIELLMRHTHLYPSDQTRHIRHRIERLGLPPISRQLALLLKQRYYIGHTRASGSEITDYECSINYGIVNNHAIKKRQTKLRQIIGIRAKLVKNGCTPEEEKSAKEHASRLEQEYGITSKPVYQDDDRSIINVHLVYGVNFHKGLRYVQENLVKVEDDDKTWVIRSHIKPDNPTGSSISFCCFQAFADMGLHYDG
jgi:hypothetical protein